MPEPADIFTPGKRATVVQQLPRQSGTLTIKVSGEIVRFEQKKTGSWYAHARDDKLWLDRLVLRKDDAEVVVCVLDQFTHVEVEDPAPAAKEAAEQAAAQPEKLGAPE